MTDFAAIVGKEHVREPVGAALDGVPISRVVRPGDARELAECLRAAARDGVALVTRGGGSKLEWGNPCTASEITLLELTRLCGRIDAQPAEGIVTVAAGVAVRDLEARLGEVGQRVLLPSIYEGATVGGSIAADPPDPLRGTERRLRDDLLELEVVLANGEITRCGGKVVKNVTGFDLGRLYCGSLGTLGVITEATLRVRALPESRRLLYLDVATSQEALQRVATWISRGVDPDAMLIESRGTRVRLWWSLEGVEPDVIDRVGRAPGQPAAASDFEAAARKLAAPAAADSVSLRIGGRPSDLAGILSALEEWCGAAGVALALPLAGLARGIGDEQGLGTLLARAEREGWALFVESAPPGVKAKLDVFGAAPPALDVVCAIKRRFDPSGVLSPGRFVARL